MKTQAKLQAGVKASIINKLRVGVNSVSPNPNGKNGDPITLAPYSFDDALRKILGAQPEPKPDKSSRKKNALHKSQKRSPNKSR